MIQTLITHLGIQVHRRWCHIWVYHAFCSHLRQEYWSLNLLDLIQGNSYMVSSQLESSYQMAYPWFEKRNSLGFLGWQNWISDVYYHKLWSCLEIVFCILHRRPSDIMCSPETSSSSWFWYLFQAIFEGIWDGCILRRLCNYTVKWSD